MPSGYRKKPKKTINIHNFKGIKVELNMEDIIRQQAKSYELMVKKVSPRSQRPNRGNPYFSTWGVDTQKTKETFGAVIWNKGNWQLTWLLENGHLITNNKSFKRGLGWSPPKPHIKPSFDKFEPQFERAIEKMKIEADFI